MKREKRARDDMLGVQFLKEERGLKGVGRRVKSKEYGEVRKTREWEEEEEKERKKVIGEPDLLVVVVSHSSALSGLSVQYSAHALCVTLLKIK